MRFDYKANFRPPFREQNYSAPKAAKTFVRILRIEMKRRNLKTEWGGMGRKTNFRLCQTAVWNFCWKLFQFLFQILKDFGTFSAFQRQKSRFFSFSAPANFFFFSFFCIFFLFCPRVTKNKKNKSLFFFPNENIGISLHT